jgi:hypothetical protein
LKYAHENGCPWDETICIAAARYNRLKCLEYAHENGCPWTLKTYIAAEERRNSCFEYVKKNNCPSDNFSRRNE